MPLRIDFMQGRLASTKVIIVHAGEIVVNKRVGVDHFKSAGWSEGAREGSSITPGDR
jgi:hypothetical protein